MNAYVETLFEIPQSIKSAERCIRTANNFNIRVEKFKAVYKTIAYTELEKEGLTVGKFNTEYSNIEAVIGNFITQYRIWKEIKNANEPGIVLEHDAVFIDKLPEKIKGDIVNFGKPSYGNYNKKDAPGFYKLFAKSGGYMGGAHGYYVTPKGADQLISKAKEIGVHPCDLFLCRQNFPRLLEYYPWPIQAHDYFTTIQVQKGCIAKHAYNKEFEIL